VAAPCARYKEEHLLIGHQIQVKSCRETVVKLYEQLLPPIALRTFHCFLLVVFIFLLPPEGSFSCKAASEELTSAHAGDVGPRLGKDLFYFLLWVHHPADGAFEAVDRSKGWEAQYRDGVGHPPGSASGCNRMAASARRKRNDDHVFGCITHRP